MMETLANTHRMEPKKQQKRSYSIICMGSLFSYIMANMSICCNVIRISLPNYPITHVLFSNAAAIT